MTALPSDDPSRPIAPLLLRLRGIADETARLDLAAADGDEIATANIANQLGAILERAISTFVVIQTLMDDESTELVVDLETDAWIPHSTDQLLPRVADVCFAGGIELRRVHRELVAAPAAERLVAAETALRKVRRAIRAVLEAARETGASDVLGGVHRGQHQVSDVASGLAVRRLYSSFRRALRDPVDDSPEAVLMAVRYAAGAMATMVASPDYPDVRASDRAVLRELRERALRWARGERSVVAGMNLLADLRTCGDLLRGINRRQELREHDHALLEKLRFGPNGDLGVWMEAVESLIGIDDTLDELIERMRGDATMVSAVIARLEELYQ